MDRRLRVTFTGRDSVLEKWREILKEGRRSVAKGEIGSRMKASDRARKT